MNQGDCKTAERRRSWPDGRCRKDARRSIMRAWAWGGGVVAVQCTLCHVCVEFLDSLARNIPQNGQGDGAGLLRVRSCFCRRHSFANRLAWSGRGRVILDPEPRRCGAAGADGGRCDWGCVGTKHMLESGADAAGAGRGGKNAGPAASSTTRTQKFLQVRTGAVGGACGARFLWGGDDSRHVTQCLC